MKINFRKIKDLGEERRSPGKLGLELNQKPLKRKETRLVDFYLRGQRIKSTGRKNT